MSKEQEIEEILTRGVSTFIDPDGSFKKKLTENPEKVVIKFGVDPTRPDLHLGHAVVLRKLRQLQNLGCKVVFLIGDFTGSIGDPTGISKIRPEIERAEIEANMKTYLDQVGKILSTDKKVFSWITNSDWFYNFSDLFFGENPDQNISKQIDLYIKTRMQTQVLGNPKLEQITIRGFLWTLRHVTHARLIERDMFRDRINSNSELYMHEMMYPVLQGIDSHVLANIYGSCDLEIGGSDQTFNMLMGRDVMKMNKQKEQAVMSMEIIEGLDGTQKMSKSLDNYIGITETPGDIYGKIMSLPDRLITKYFTLATHTPMSDIEKMEQDLKGEKVNPRDLKMQLAKQIVFEYHGEAGANSAEEDFVSKFQKKEIPDEMEEVKISGDGSLADVLVEKKIVESKSEWRRLVEAGAIMNLDTKEKVSDPNIKLEKDTPLKIGKHRFVKIVIE